MNDGKLLTTAEVAEILTNVSTRTLEDWRRKGCGPDFVTLGARTVRYRPAAVDRWILDRERKTPQRVA